MAKKKQKQNKSVSATLWRFDGGEEHPNVMLGNNRYRCNERAASHLNKIDRGWRKQHNCCLARSPLLGIPVVAQIDPDGVIVSVRRVNAQEIDISRPATWRVGLITGVDTDAASGDMIATFSAHHRCTVRDPKMAKQLTEAAQQNLLVNVRVVPNSIHCNGRDVALEAIVADWSDEPYGLRYSTDEPDAEWISGRLDGSRRIYWPNGSGGDAQDAFLLSLSRKGYAAVDGDWPIIASPRAGAAIKQYGVWRADINLQVVREFSRLVREPYRRVVGWRIGDANQTELREHYGNCDQRLQQYSDPEDTWS